MSEYTELLERLDFDANCGPGDGLPSMLDIVAMDCKTAAEAIRSLLAERSANAIVRDAIFALMPESLYWAEVPDDIKALRERAAKAEAELAAANARLERVRGASTALVDRMDKLAGDLQGVFTFYHAHGMKWPQDANWKKEFDALRAALGEE